MATSAASVLDEHGEDNISPKTSSRPSSSASSASRKKRKPSPTTSSDVYAEAKGNGYDTKAPRTIVRMRKQDANERAGAGDHPGDLSCRRLGML